jgi:hypothetical protein
LKISFAVLCDDVDFEPWQQLCLERLLRVPEVRAVLLIHPRAPTPSRALSRAGVASLPALTLDNNLPPDEAFRLQLRQYDLDFILNFSAARIAEGLLEAARHGVWALHFGDWIRYRGGPGAFWEVYEAQPITAALLVRLQQDPDAVVVLREGYVRSNFLSAARNRAQLLAHIVHWPAQVCIDLGNGVAGCLTSAPLRSTARARTAPTRAQRFNYRCRILARAARTGFESLFRHDQWNVGRIDRPISSFLNSAGAPPVHWLKSPRRSEYFADPFGAWREGRLTILYEHFSYRSNRGTIAAIESAQNADTPHVGAQPVATAVRIGPQPAVHLSYPYLFEAQNRLLCVPESYEAAEVGLYELERFPDRWSKVANLLEATHVVDASVFQHDGRWWLAGSEPTHKGASCELNLWYAAAPSGPWQPHPGNPVKIDVRSARPGGTPFHAEGVLYRPAQDCTRTYGDRIIINRVVTLTTTAFCEVPAATVEPDPTGPYPAGLHTLSSVGNSTLIDAKRVIFSPAQFRRVLLHYLRLPFR